MNKIGSITCARPILKSGALLRTTGSAVINLVDFIYFGIDLGSGAQSIPGWETDWRVSDARLLSSREHNLMGRVYGRSGSISARAPYFNPSHDAIGLPTQSGLGTVGLLRKTTRRSLLGEVTALNTPMFESAGANIATIWETQTGIVDVTVESSANSPGYRIYGSGLYGPTGYWVTKSRSDIRINQTVNVEWYATDYECATFNYELKRNDVTIATGTMNSGSHVTHPILFDQSGDVQLSVTLSDENGKSYELVGPLLQVQNVPTYAGEILLPIENGRYRIGTPVSVKVHYPICEAWSVVHRFNSSTVEVGRGTLTIPGEATTEFTLVPNPELGTHYLDLILYDIIGPQDPADTVEFFVTEYDELLSS